MTQYDAIVKQNDRETSVSIEAGNLSEAREMLESKFGKGSIVKIEPFEKSKNKHRWLPVLSDKNEIVAKKHFFKKLKKMLGRVPFLEDVVAAYFCAVDPKTPKKVKATLWGAIAYFVIPLDTLPDFIPLVGYSDDWAALATAIGIASYNITDEHYLDACLWLGKGDKCQKLLKKRLAHSKEELSRAREGIIEWKDESAYMELKSELERISQELRDISEMSGPSTGADFQSMEKLRMEIDCLANRILTCVGDL